MHIFTCTYIDNGSSNNIPCYPPNRHQSHNAVYQGTGKVVSWESKKAAAIFWQKKTIDALWFCPWIPTRRKLQQSILTLTCQILRTTAATAVARHRNSVCPSVKCECQWKAVGFDHSHWLPSLFKDCEATTNLLCLVTDTKNFMKLQPKNFCKYKKNLRIFTIMDTDVVAASQSRRLSCPVWTTKPNCIPLTSAPGGSVVRRL